MSPGEKAQEAPLPDPSVLGWLLATQNVLQILPRTRQVAEFVSSALLDVPGVEKAGMCVEGDDRDPCSPCPALQLGYCEHSREGCGLAPQTKVFPLATARGFYGRLVLEVDQTALFSLYEPFLSNFAGSVGLLLENREQRHRLEETLDRLTMSERKYRLLFSEMISGVAVHEIIVDEQGAPVDYRFLEINAAFEDLTGLKRDDIVGKTVREAIPDIEASWIERYGRVALLGENARFEEYSAALGRHYEVLAYRAGDGQFATLFTDVTERKRRQEEIRASNERLQVISATASLLLETADPQKVVDTIARRVLEALDCQVYLNYLTEPGQDRLRLHTSAGVSEGMREDLEWLDYGESVSGWVARSRTRRVESHIGRSSDPLLRIVRSLGLETYACYPLVSKGRLLGTLSFGSRTRDAFSPDDLSLMQVIAGQVAVAVERRQEEELLQSLYEAQSHIAERLQAALLELPASIGDIRLGHAYHSATEMARVGGDFYDAFDMGRGKTALLIGDVAGHGIEAARTATLVRDVINAFTHQSHRPEEVLRRTNQLLVSKRLAGFVTLFLVVFDRDTQVMRYACAGHPEAVLRRASGAIHLLGTGSPPLGVFQGARWQPGHETLEPGDLVLLYTDGVTEARSAGVFFGEERLLHLVESATVPTERLPDRIADAVIGFTEGALVDDMALLAFSLEPSRLANQAATPPQNEAEAPVTRRLRLKT